MLTNTLTKNHYINSEVTVFVPVKTIIKAGVRLRVLMHLVQTSNIGVCYFQQSKSWGGSLGFYSQCHLCFEIWHIVIDVELRTSNSWTCKNENRKYLQRRLLLIMLKSHCMRSFLHTGFTELINDHYLITLSRHSDKFKLKTAQLKPIHK